MSTNPLVSVIIPAYNHEKYVQETIKSIINQTYKNIELIILDDGSKDSTWNKIQEMKEICEKRFVRVHFETKENEGSCKTLNKLINYASGEYVFLIASDDMAKAECIEAEVKFLDNNPDYVLATGNNEFIDKDGKTCYWDKDRNIVYDIQNAKYKTFAEWLQHREHLNFNSKEFGSYRSLYKGNYVPNGYTIRKNVFAKTGLYTPEAPLEDWYMNLQIAKFGKMKYLDKVLFSYRWHDSNTVHNVEKMKAMSQKTISYEDKIINDLAKTTKSKDIIDIAKNGVLYKRFGIPYLIELQTFTKCGEKIKWLKLFNLTIFKFVK